MIKIKKTTDEYMVWVITKYQNNKTYYLFEIDTDKNQYKWTLCSINSLMFHNYQGANQFIKDYLLNDKIENLKVEQIKDPDYPIKF